jgi:hypothetical protein
MDRLRRKIKGKGKEPEITHTLVKRKAPDLLSRVHLVADPDIPTNYAYHLHPLMPPLYHMVVENEKELIPVLEETVITLVHASEGREVGKTTFEKGFHNGAVNKTVWIGLDGDIRVYIWASFYPNLILAEWSMEVPMFGHNNSSENVLNQNDSSGSEKEREAVAAAAFAMNDQSDQSDDGAPPPYEENKPPPVPPAYDIDSDSKGQYLALPVYFPPKAEKSSQPQPEKYKYHNSLRNPPATWKRDVGFAWVQVSSRARLKLICTKKKVIYAEFIQETDAKKIAAGVKGQLLFRKSFDRQWEMAALLTLGVLIELSKGKVWDE